MALKPVRSSNALVVSLAPTSGSGGNNTYIYYGRDWDNISVNFDGYDLGGNPSDQRTHVALDPRLIDPDISLDDEQSITGGVLPVVVDSDDVEEGGSGGENIFVAHGNDTVSGNGGPDLIVGGDGNDTLDGGDSDDRLFGDYVNIPDYIYDFDHRRVAFWKLELPDEEDTSVSGDDLLRGGDGADQLFGGPGNDQLDGGPRGDGNADLLVGGPGADIFYLNYDDGDDPNASSFWFDYANTVTDAFAEDSLKDFFNTVTRDVASSIFADPGAGFILSGTVDVLAANAQLGIDALFGLTEAPKPPKNLDDVMVVADFDPREDVLALPHEAGKALSTNVNPDMTAPVGGLTGVGIEFSTIDGLFAQVFLDEGFLAEFDLTNQATTAEDFLNNVLQTSLLIESTENPHDPDQGGVQNGVYLFPTDDDSYIDGQAPDGIEEKIAVAAPPGTTTEIFGAFAPWSLIMPANLTTKPFVAGTDMGDLLNTNSASFAPEDANTSGVVSDLGSYVKGFGGSDIIIGNKGLDVIFGGNGDDDIYGIGQDDVEFQEQFFGEADNDRIFLGWSSTWALADGGDGIDWVDFLYLDHKLTLDLTKTEMSGSSFNPSNFDTSRYDVINIENAAGTRLDDTIIGTDGNNILQGNDGSDIIQTGGGTDTVSFADNSGKVEVNLTSVSNGTLTSDEYGEDGTADADTVVSNDTITGGLANLIGSDFDDRLTGDAVANVIDGGAGNDTIRGEGGNDTLTGGAGDDDIIGHAGADDIDGGSGDDTLEGDNGDDTLKGGAGNDLIQGDHDNDWLEGGDGDDQLQGGNDDDTLSGDAGDDTVFGDSGDDAILWSSLHGNDVINGGADDDTLTLQTTTAFAKALPVSLPIRLTASGNTLSISLPILPTADLGNEVLTVTNVETIVFEPLPDQPTDELIGTMPDVVVDGLTDMVTTLIWTGDDADNLFDGGNATTQALMLDGAGGDDTLTGGQSADTLEGGDGADTLSGGADGDTIFGGADNDMIFGNAGSDILNGEDGDDQIDGGGGADMIDGGAGSDLINGGNGTDSFTWAVGDGGDFIAGDVDTDDLTLDADNGVAGLGTTIIVSVVPVIDLFDPGSIVPAVQFSVIASTAEIFTMIDVENFTIDADPDGTTTGVSGDLSAAGVSENTVTFNGAEGADTFDGSGMFGGVRVVLNGGGGDDTLIGGSADDVIDGGDGTDAVVYDGLRSGFSTDLMDDGGIVVGHAHGETDTLSDIERIDFADGALIYDLQSPNLDFVYCLYAAAFDRAPDEAGLRFWTGVLDFFDANLPERDKEDYLASQILASDEYNDLYDPNLSNAEYVDALYRNVHDRLPDDAGRAFWIDVLDSGVGRDLVLISFAVSDESKDNLAPDLDDGVWVV